MISARELRFRYGPEMSELFDGLSHSFSSGSLTAVIGPSGCGKSTLLFVLGLLLTPTDGYVEINGTVVRSWSDRRKSWVRATQIGFVFQDAALDSSRTLLDNVLEPALYARQPHSTARAEAVDLLTRFGVEHRHHHLPGQISGGQAQRVALCRALLNRPQLVLADEPTGNLDGDSGRWVIEALHAIAHDGGTVVVATHDPSVVDRCDEVLRLG